MLHMYLCRLQYFVLVVVIFVMEIVAGVLAFVYRHDIENFLSQELLAGIRQHYPRESDPDPEGLRAAWAFIQSEVTLVVLLTWNLGTLLPANYLKFLSHVVACFNH